MMPARFSGSAALMRAVSPVRPSRRVRRSPSTASGSAYCSPTKPLTKRAAAHVAAHLHPPHRPQHVAPGHREVLARDDVPEDDAVPRQQLPRDLLRQLVLRRRVRLEAVHDRPPPLWLRRARRPSAVAAVPPRLPRPRRSRRRHDLPQRREAVARHQTARHKIPQRFFELRRELPARRRKVVEEQRAVLPQRIKRRRRRAGRRILRLFHAAHRLQQPAEVAPHRQRDRRRPLRR